MWGDAYVFSPAAIMAPEDSAIRRPEDLKGQDIAVGYHSGSHFATLQALKPFLATADIQLRFVSLCLLTNLVALHSLRIMSTTSG
jgi:ABC-type taurine transport system substrate-binding protein